MDIPIRRNLTTNIYVITQAQHESQDFEIQNSKVVLAAVTLVNYLIVLLFIYVKQIY